MLLRSPKPRPTCVDSWPGRSWEPHGIGEWAAFEMLRSEARRSNRRLVDVADAVALSRAMPPARAATPAESEQGSGA